MTSGPESLRIAQILGSVESEASGPSHTVPGLSRGLAALGHDVDMLSLGRPFASSAGGFRDLRFAPDWSRFAPARKLGLSRGLRRQIADGSYSVLHTHGLWMMPNIYPSATARTRGVPLLLSPRGMLGAAALAFSSGRKRLFWVLAQRRAVQAVACFHATSDQEYDDIREFGLRQPVAVIANGIEMPPFELAVRPNRNERYVLSLGRVHPKKGLARLVRAWAMIEAEFGDWRLKIVGPDERGHKAEVEALIRSLGLHRVEVLPPVFGGEKYAMMRAADLFVLSTLNENFAVTVPESLSVGTPVISTKGAPWSGLEENGCGWWIDHGDQILAAKMREALSLAPEQRADMGAKGRAWVAQAFGWDGIARQMADVYRWLIEGGDQPECVRMD